MAAEVKTPLPPLAAEPQALPATPVPEAAQGPWVEVVQREAGREVHIRFGEGAQARAWRVRGLEKNLSPDTLKVNVRMAIGQLNNADGSGAFHVDTLDLYNAKQRGHFAAQAQLETGVDERTLKTDLGRVLMALETVQDEAIAEVLQPTPADAMAEPDRAAARPRTRR